MGAKQQIFVDTSGFYALLVAKDEAHEDAASVLKNAQQSRRGFVTSDYVLDETATLLRARGFLHLLTPFFDAVMASRACHVEWISPERFSQARQSFLTHAERGWSFTDCVNFSLMKEFHLKEALSKDGHFREAGFTPLLAPA